MRPVPSRRGEATRVKAGSVSSSAKSSRTKGSNVQTNFIRKWHAAIGTRGYSNGMSGAGFPPFAKNAKERGARLSATAVIVTYGSYTRTWNVPGIVDGRGCGCSLVGSGALPNSAVSTKMRFVLGS